MKIKSFEEVGEELCEYCPLEERQKGVHNYGGVPVFCEDSGACREAYDCYCDYIQQQIENLEDKKDYVWQDKNKKLYKLKDISDIYLKNILTFISEGGGDSFFLTDTRIKELFDEAKRRKIQCETNYKRAIQLMKNKRKLEIESIQMRQN